MSTEIRQSFMVRKSLRISLPAFWTRTSPKHFYEAFNGLKITIAILRSINIRLVIYLDDILLMWKTLEETLLNRDTLNISTSEIGFRNQYQEIGFRTNLSYRVFRSDYKHLSNDFIFK